MIRALSIIFLFLISACHFTPAEQTFDDALAQAQAGDAKAQSTLAAMYYHGRNVTQDYKLAFDWYNKAAAQGYADAQYNLAVAYINGQGVKRNYKTAAEWNTKAAEQGHVDAKYNLGGAYLNGQGVAQDNKRAYIWFALAAATGDADAAASRDRVATHLTPEQRKTADSEVTELQKKFGRSEYSKK
jgi:TPR repeat protein